MRMCLAFSSQLILFYVSSTDESSLEKEQQILNNDKARITYDQQHVSIKIILKLFHAAIGIDGLGGLKLTYGMKVSDYEKEIKIRKSLTKEEYFAFLIRRSNSFSRGVSMYGGVAR
ncbi:hypothetical protein REPUB_Repub19eG0084200 [Reevesia pubescens]